MKNNKEDPYKKIDVRRNDYLSMIRADISEAEEALAVTEKLLTDTKELLKRAKLNHAGFKMRRALKYEINHEEENRIALNWKIYRLRHLLYLFGNV